MFPISDSIHTNKFPIITVTIILVTAFVFFLQITSTNPDLIIRNYAVIPSLVHFSNISTLLPFVTAIFLHGGFLHILSNLWFLWIFGDDVEGTIGYIPYIFLYFLAGIVGNVVQYFLMASSSIPMLGASGAIAGVLGAYFVMFPFSKIKTLLPIFYFVTIVNIPAPIMLGYWFVLQLLSGAVSLPFAAGTGGVAFWAHVGGFMTGVLFGLFFKNRVYGNVYE